MTEQNPFDRVEKGMHVLAAKEHWEQTNRLQLLWGHAIVGITIGILMIIDGTAPAFLELLAINQLSFFIGFPFVLGGTTLAIGLAMIPRNMVLEIVGLACMLLTDVTVAILLLISYFKVEGSKAYPIIVYAGLAWFLSVHIRSLFIYLDARHRYGSNK